MVTFKGKKRPKSPWDYLIEKGHATEEEYEAYEAALEKGDVTEAQAIEAGANSGMQRKKKSS